jgi:uncharacterized protein (UPF0335 family)
MTDQYKVTADELRGFVERIEAQNARIKDETEARKDIYAEAVGRGYDKKAIAALVSLRKQKPDQVAEFEAVLEIYRSAMGMA